MRFHCFQPRNLRAVTRHASVGVCGDEAGPRLEGAEDTRAGWHCGQQAALPDEVQRNRFEFQMSNRWGVFSVNMPHTAFKNLLKLGVYLKFKFNRASRSSVCQISGGCCEDRQRGRGEGSGQAGVR